MKFDIRVVPHHMRRGELTDEEYEAFLATLPDDADECVPTETTFSTPAADRLAAEAKADAEQSV